MRFRIDSVEGNRQRLDGGAMFGNAPKPLWQRWIAPDQRNRIPLACRAFLVRDQDAGTTYMLDSGIGCFFEPKLKDRFGVDQDGHQLLLNLRALGVEPEQIDVVVLSHLHFDHAGGLLSAWHSDRDLELVFPNAKVVTGKRAWERANQPKARDRASFIPELHRLLQDTGRLELLDDSADEIRFEVFSFTVSDGHTPGLLLAELRGDNNKAAVFCADLIPGTPWMHLPITMGYDRFPELIVEEKTAFLARHQAADTMLLFAHDPTHAAAYIAKDERGRYCAREAQEKLEDFRL